MNHENDKYKNRQNLEFFQWPELSKQFQDIAELVMVSANNLTRQLRSELFTMASVAGGCQHCQAHGAYTLHLMGVDAERIRDIWTFEDPRNSAQPRRQRCGLPATVRASRTLSSPRHFDDLRRHYSDRQIVEMLAVISLSGWFNRWNNSIATVTDQESVDWAQDQLKGVGWTLGKHAGEAHEQRRKHPRSSDGDKIEY